jgi:hypothetical protein
MQPVQKGRTKQKTIQEEREENVDVLDACKSLSRLFSSIFSPKTQLPDKLGSKEHHKL